MSSMKSILETWHSFFCVKHLGVSLPVVSGIKHPTRVLPCLPHRLIRSQFLLYVLSLLIPPRVVIRKVRGWSLMALSYADFLISEEISES